MERLTRLLPIVATLLVGAANAIAFRGETASGPWITQAMVWAPLLALALLVLAREEMLKDTFALVPGDVSRGIAGAALIVVVAYVGGRLALKVAPLPILEELRTTLVIRNAISPEWKRALVVVAFAAAEEIVFRGAVTVTLEERFGSARAPWVASGLYVVAMIPTLRPSIIGAAIALGAVTAFVVARYRRPFIAIVAHAAFVWVVLEIVTPFLYAKGLGR